MHPLLPHVQIYMGVSIGNAAWPIGVTQVGLHERSAREKIRLGASSAVVRAFQPPQLPALLCRLPPCS
jgi:pre-mRNA-splicing factor 18